jgi:hypothetical protein
MGDALVRDEDGSPLIHFAPHLEGDRLRDDMKRDDDAAEAQGWLDMMPPRTITD